MAPLAAQPPDDSLPTRRGRWAAEAGLGFDQTNLGALYFLGPRSALGFNTRFEFQNRGANETSFGRNPGFAFAALSATAGYRRYGRARDRIAGFAGAGALLAYGRQSSGRQSNTDLGLGGYGEVGAAYLVARRLSVNLSTQLEVRRTVARNVSDVQDEVELAVTSGGWRAVAGGVRIAATLFF